MHPLLRRQLKRHGPVLPDEDPPALWAGLLGAVNSAYAQADEDRRMLERSLELTSKELNQNYMQIEAQRQELQRSNAELESFAQIASHDLEPTRMRALIEDLLTYARVSSRARPFEQTELDEVLADALGHLKVRIDETRATIDHAELPAVMGDRDQLAQLFQNLIANAVKFHKPGTHPTVTVGVEPRELEYVISVVDDGIEPEDRDKGGGLGLAVCRKIVERHGGTIWVDSDPGKGATFRFTIPK